MTIEVLGTIGELVAAVATIGTLGYLAVQIRGTAAATRAEARRSTDADGNETVRQIASDSELSRIYMVGLATPEKLDPAQAFRFRLSISMFFSAMETAWEEYRLGTISESEARNQFGRTRAFFVSPGGKAWWRENSEMFPPEFREYFADLMDD
jgi:hypothetical protein